MDNKLSEAELFYGITLRKTFQKFRAFRLSN